MLVVLSTFTKRKGCKPSKGSATYVCKTFKGKFGIMTALHKLLHTLDLLFINGMGEESDIVFKIHLINDKK